ncbi:hypothetical protein U1Q18_018737 [Sarracenia purpurea var. burkii]
MFTEAKLLSMATEQELVRGNPRSCGSPLLYGMDFTHASCYIPLRNVSPLRVLRSFNWMGQSVLAHSRRRLGSLRAGGAHKALMGKQLWRFVSEWETLPRKMVEGNYGRAKGMYVIVVVDITNKELDL